VHDHDASLTRKVLGSGDLFCLLLGRLVYDTRIAESRDARTDAGPDEDHQPEQYNAAGRRYKKELQRNRGRLTILPADEGLTALLWDALLEPT
jgi:hypothetical protein